MPGGKGSRYSGEENELVRQMPVSGVSFLDLLSMLQCHSTFSRRSRQQPCGMQSSKKVHTRYQKCIIIRLTMSLRLVERGLARVAGQSCLASPSVPQRDLSVAVSLVVLW